MVTQLDINGSVKCRFFLIGGHLMSALIEDVPAPESELVQRFFPGPKLMPTLMPVSEPAPEPVLGPVVEQPDPMINDLADVFSHIQLHVLDLDECKAFNDDAIMHVKLLSNKATIPYKEHDDDAGFDVTYIKPFCIEPKQRVLVPLGLALWAPHGTYLQVAPCSGLAKHGIDVLAGIVNQDYIGEVSI
ncbi:hypothetical protein GGI24_004044 [Coemansia furcata]|nr:hypothetical protein GGI24_004044 [Coemansia furcata]